MLFNIYDYDNQLLEQIEARDISEAWFKARSLYGNVLDVRPSEEISQIGEKEYKRPSIFMPTYYKEVAAREISTIMKETSIQGNRLSDLMDSLKKAGKDNLAERVYLMRETLTSHYNDLIEIRKSL